MRALALVTSGSGNILQHQILDTPTPKKGEALIKVVVYPWTFCGKCSQCKTGNENICDKAGTTAYHLISRARVKNKSVVLVTGATGGVGTAVIQLLKRKKCKVICTTSCRDKIPKLKQLGADFVVSTDKLRKQVKNLYPEGVNYVMDIMGGSVWSQALEVLAKNGTIVFCATTFDGLGIINIGNTFAKQLNILGSYGGRKKDLKSIINLFKKGAVKPVIDSVFSFNRVELGFKKLAAKKAFGKIILKL